MLRQAYYIAQVLKNQWKSPEELKKLQQKRLKKMIEYAYEKSELYHRKFREAHVTPADFNTLEDLQKFPLITKADIRELFPQGVVSTDYRLSQCIHASTSGSTGNVLPILYSPAAYQYQMAVTYRNFAALGFKPWHKFAYTRYEPIHTGAPFYEKFGIGRNRFISVYLSSEKQLELIREFNPHAITGYPSLMIEWARLIKEQGDTINPLFIRTEAEILTKEAKQFMENVFGCELYEEYGSIEFVNLAFECAHRGYHISSDNLVLEFLEHGEPVSSGEEGEIYATSLVNYAMPFIRYKMMDRGVPVDGECSCGRGLPLMKLIEGRDDDFIQLPSGKKLSPRLVIPIFELAGEVKEFRVVQKKRDLIEVDIIPEPDFTEKTKKNLEKTFRDVLGEPVEIVFNICDKIPRGRHNRPRPVRSYV
jgi:phenylacetate-CoA ligase